jgi:NADP-reducing hydrogenase subunit HndD
MALINITIDEHQIMVPKGETILEAAKKLHIEIPTLCYLNLPEMHVNNKAASCRICVVEVAGRHNLAPACSTPAAEGMVVKTHTPRVLKARKTVLELLLSDHPKDCLVCGKSGNCELQDLTDKFGVRKIHYEGEMSSYAKDTSAGIIRDMDKCVMCRRCETMCNEVQTVGVLSAINRGFEAVVSPAFEMPLNDSVCTFCGQCVAVCPTGALSGHNHSWSVVEALADPEKVVVVQTAPAVRAALGETLGLPPGTLVTGKMVAALRQLGFDYVFDTDFAADLTIMEEGSELLDRLSRYLNGDTTVKLPLLTSCCPAWVKFFEHQFPELLDVPSTAKSPQQMFGSIAKSYYAEMLGIPREKMVVVSIMPCLAKKYEAARPEFQVDGNPDVDVVLSTRELGCLIKNFNIEFGTLSNEDFDQPLGESTGAAVLFGTTGGVIEAAVRTAAEMLTGKDLPQIDFKELRGMDGVRSATINIAGLELHIGIAHELGNARKLLEKVEKGEEHFHAIEIMSCPGGCIGGGGQPFHHGDEQILEMRRKAIYNEDRNKVIRKSHQNPSIIKLYEDYLDKPLSEKAHKLLHTHYFERSKM